MFNSQDFGLKEGNLYEIIATTYAITNNGKEIKPNASCMGIRMIEGEQIQISPFYSTITYKNLKEYSTIAFNFVDDVYLYALAALKEPDSPINLTDFPSKYYDFKYLESRAMDVPYINKAWAYLICEVSEQLQKVKESAVGEYKTTEFRLNILFSKKLKESYNLFNRADNLAIESIILATRMKVAKSTNNQDLYNKCSAQLTSFINSIERFGENRKALKAINLVKRFIKNI